MLPRVLLLSMLSVAMACASNKAAETSPASYLIHGVGDEVTLTIPS